MKFINQKTRKRKFDQFTLHSISEDRAGIVYNAQHTYSIGSRLVSEQAAPEETIANIHLLGVDYEGHLYKRYKVYVEVIPNDETYYHEIGMWFEGNELIDYDGVSGYPPRQVIAFLKEFFRTEDGEEIDFSYAEED